MEVHHQWRSTLSYKIATILVCFVNLLAALLLFQGFFTGSDRRGARTQHYAQLKYVIESEEIRRAMEPFELIKRLKEIEQETYSEPEPEIKQTAAVGLSKRLKDLRATNDANSQRALEEWRKRKMERARQRQIEKNGTSVSQAP